MVGAGLSQLALTVEPSPAEELRSSTSKGQMRDEIYRNKVATRLIASLMIRSSKLPFSQSAVTSSVATRATQEGISSLFCGAIISVFHYLTRFAS